MRVSSTLQATGGKQLGMHRNPNRAGTGTRFYRLRRLCRSGRPLTGTRRRRDTRLGTHRRQPAQNTRGQLLDREFGPADTRIRGSQQSRREQVVVRGQDRAGRRERLARLHDRTPGTRNENELRHTGQGGNGTVRPQQVSKTLGMGLRSDEVRKAGIGRKPGQTLVDTLHQNAEDFGERTIDHA